MSSQPRTSEPSPVSRLAEQIESTTGLDAVTSKVSPIAERLVSPPPLANLLRSGPLGHALHPVLTDVPLGAWISTAVLDWGGPQMRPASQRLLAIGNVAALPTAVTGLAEYAGLDARAKRVATVHAVANYVALSLNVASWAARRKDQHVLGRALTLGALSVGGFGAFLGGHLAIGMKVGTHASSVHVSPVDTTT